MSVCVYVCVYVCACVCNEMNTLMFLGDRLTDLGKLNVKCKVLRSHRTLLNGFGIGFPVPEIWPEQGPDYMALEPRSIINHTKPIMRHLK